jgi:hypothetical protein
MLTQYQNLENQESEVGLFVTQNYYWYFILFALVVICIIILAYSSSDENTSSAVKVAVTNSVQIPIEIVKNTARVVNPFYVLFAVILFFTITYSYNQYYQNVYNNLPSAKNYLNETNLLYVFVILFIIVGVGSRFIQR